MGVLWSVLNAHKLNNLNVFSLHVKLSLCSLTHGSVLTSCTKSPQKKASRFSTKPIGSKMCLISSTRVIILLRKSAVWLQCRGVGMFVGLYMVLRDSLLYEQSAWEDSGRLALKLVKIWQQHRRFNNCSLTENLIISKNSLQGAQT